MRGGQKQTLANGSLGSEGVWVLAETVAVTLAGGRVGLEPEVEDRPHLREELLDVVQGGIVRDAAHCAEQNGVKKSSPVGVKCGEELCEQTKDNV